MQYVPSLSDFVSRNHTEIKKIVHNICIKNDVSSWEDILQDFYKNMICRNILHKYDPNHPSATKISTYIYKVILNLVRVHKKSNEYLMEKRKINLDLFTFVREDEDPYDLNLEENCWQNNPNPSPLYEKYSLISENLMVDYENKVCRNGLSDDIDSMNFDLNLFEKFLEKRNKFYSLTKRKNKKKQINSLNLLEVFRLLRKGYINREIAQMYGVSNMFITTIKHEIKKLMIEFGIIWNRKNSWSSNEEKL